MNEEEAARDEARRALLQREGAEEEEDRSPPSGRGIDRLGMIRMIGYPMTPYDTI